MNPVAEVLIAWLVGWLGVVLVLVIMIRLWPHDYKEDPDLILDQLEDDFPMVAAKLLLIWPYILFKLFNALVRGEDG
jgi:hypothetical protein